MRLISTDGVAWSVCLSVRQTVSSAKATEPIEMNDPLAAYTAAEQYWQCFSVGWTTLKNVSPSRGISTPI